MNIRTPFQGSKPRAHSKPRPILQKTQNLPGLTASVAPSVRMLGDARNQELFPKSSILDPESFLRNSKPTVNIPPSARMLSDARNQELFPQSSILDPESFLLTGNIPPSARMLGVARSHEQFTNKNKSLKTSTNNTPLQGSKQCAHPKPRPILQKTQNLPGLTANVAPSARMLGVARNPEFFFCKDNMLKILCCGITPNNCAINIAQTTGRKLLKTLGKNVTPNKRAEGATLAVSPVTLICAFCKLMGLGNDDAPDYRALKGRPYKMQPTHRSYNR